VCILYLTWQKSIRCINKVVCQICLYFISHVSDLSVILFVSLLEIISKNDAEKFAVYVITQLQCEYGLMVMTNFFMNCWTNSYF